MKNLIQAINLQQEKLDAIKFLLRRIETDNQNQTTSDMLKDLKITLNDLILTDF
jgi:mannose/fructose-specific phosphotransferase system component IIA